MTLVNKIIQLSGAQFYNLSGVHCIVCSPPQVKSLSTTIYPLFTLLQLRPPTSRSNHHTVVCVHEFFSFLLFSSIPPPPHPPTHPSHPNSISLLSFSESVSILLISSFCSLDFTYEWNHVAFVFLWLCVRFLGRFFFFFFPVVVPFYAS